MRRITKRLGERIAKEQRELGYKCFVEDVVRFQEEGVLDGHGALAGNIRQRLDEEGVEYHVPPEPETEEETDV